MSRKRIKQYLVLLTAVGVIAVVASSPGTFASFSAQVTNSGNKFATGTLALSDSANNGAACFSYGGSSNSTNTNACGTVIDISGSPAKPGDNIVTGTVTVENTGSIDPSKLTLFAPGSSDCTDTVVTALGNLNSATGNPLCGAVVAYVEETSQTDASNNTTNNTYCWYGYSANSNTTCDTTKADLNTNNSDTLAAFDTQTAATPIELKPVSSSGTLASSGSELAPNTSRTFQVGLYLPTSAGNAVQGLESTFGMTWHIDQ
jgi:hypothetical protein